jgi:hypothetical protein
MISVRSYLDAPPVAGYAAWYDASDLSTIIQSAGAVSQWNDKSPNLRNVAQATTANKPLTGYSINGLNALRFDGTNDVLIGARPMTAQPYTWCVVAQKLGSPSAPAMCGTYQGDAAGNSAFYKSSANDAIRNYSGTDLVAAGQGWGVKPHVCCGIVNGNSNSVVSVDGRPATTGNAGTTAPGTPNWAIGGQALPSNYWQGYIGEVIVYTSALSPVNRLAVEQYLIQKWLY